MIYFDNAATTIHKPPGVAEAVVDAMSSMGNAGRGAHEVSLDASRMIYDVREKLCTLFNGDNPMRIAFTSNATESLNTAIKGLIEPGDHFITTAAEHNSVLRPSYEMQRAGAILTVAACDEKGRVNPDDIEKSIRAETKAVICTCGSNVTGNLTDINRIGEIASEHGLIFIADASQAAGEIPLDVKESRIDVLCFTGHKGLMGPQGTGGIYVREGIDIRPLKTGGSGVKSFSKLHPGEMPTALEAGTLNSHGIAGLGAAVDYISEKGVSSIYQKTINLARNFYDGIKNIRGIKFYGDFDTEKRLPIVSLNIGDLDSSYVSDALFREYGIATRPGAHCAPLLHQAMGTENQGAVRFSFSCFNTEDEVEKAVEAVNEIAKRKGE